MPRDNAFVSKRHNFWRISWSTGPLVNKYYICQPYTWTFPFILLQQIYDLYDSTIDISFLRQITVLFLFSADIFWKCVHFLPGSTNKISRKGLRVYMKNYPRGVGMSDFGHQDSLHDQFFLSVSSTPGFSNTAHQRPAIIRRKGNKRRPDRGLHTSKLNLLKNTSLMSNYPTTDRSTKCSNKCI